MDKRPGIFNFSPLVIMPCGKKHTRGGRRRRRRGGRRRMPWAGWGRLAPGTHARTVMLRKCGRKCFLGPGKSFPVCAKGTCKVNDKGLYAAYVRARQWGKSKKKYKGKSRPRHSQKVYRSVARKARRRLAKRGKLRTKRRRRVRRRRRRRGGMGGIYNVDGTINETVAANPPSK